MQSNVTPFVSGNRVLSKVRGAALAKADLPRDLESTNRTNPGFPGLLSSRES